MDAINLLPRSEAGSTVAVRSTKAALVASLTAAIAAALADGDDETVEMLGARVAKVLARPLPEGVATIDPRAKRGAS